MIRADLQDTVTVHYVGTLADGTEFDRSPQERPLQFIIGKNEVIAGFDEAVVGMYQGETKTVVVPCEKAYGDIRSDQIETVERAMLPANLELEVGRRLEVTRQDDSVFHVTVRALTDTTVTLDGNHPLAGQDLTFDIKLIEVRKQEQAPPQSMMAEQPPTKH